jgi:hypothetical protein
VEIDHTTLACSFWFVGAHGLGAQANHVETAHQIDVDGALKTRQQMGAGFANRAFGGGNASAVDQATELAQALGFGDHRCSLLFVGNIAMHEHPAKFSGNGFAFFILHIGDHDFATVIGSATVLCLHPNRTHRRSR